MTRPSRTTKSQGPLSLDARARLFAEIGADCWSAIADRPSEAEIAALAAETSALWREWSERDACAALSESKSVTVAKTDLPRRRPTLASVAKQASKAAIAVARYEVKPDGSVVVVTGAGEPSTESNPWLDDLKVTKQ